jgi:transposase-like protein
MPADTTNHRSVSRPNTLLTDDSRLTLKIPRDRDGTFARN